MFDLWIARRETTIKTAIVDLGLHKTPPRH
ncbi:hypothetical protein VPHF89G1_0039 [Vibrio phage F89 g1]